MFVGGLDHIVGTDKKRKKNKQQISAHSGS